jgi:uncharacterized protein YecE (DUF72 family)
MIVDTLQEMKESMIWRVGTSGWSYPPSSGPGSWTGAFYPLKRTDELKFYSRYFNTVEINSTFYRPCSPKTAEGWVERSPDDFEFTAKAWQLFTHQREWSEADLLEFKDGLAPLRQSGKLGCLLFQFPASFHFRAGNAGKLEELLESFAEYPAAVELRHRSWNDHLSLLQQFHAAPVLIDEPKFKDSIQQEFAPAGSILYLRFHGRRGEKWWRHEHRNERYDYLYTPEEIAPYAVQLRQAASASAIEKAYIIFNNHPGAKAVVNAAMMRNELGEPLTAELPETLTTRYTL